MAGDRASQVGCEQNSPENGGARNQVKNRAEEFHNSQRTRIVAEYPSLDKPSNVWGNCKKAVTLPLSKNRAGKTLNPQPVQRAALLACGAATRGEFVASSLSGRKLTELRANPQVQWPGLLVARGSRGTYQLLTGPGNAAGPGKYVPSPIHADLHVGSPGDSPQNKSRKWLRPSCRRYAVKELRKACIHLGHHLPPSGL